MMMMMMIVIVMKMAINDYDDYDNTDDYWQYNDDGDFNSVQ